MSEPVKKIAVVTGANTGLGFETSLGLAKAGYYVVLACRSEVKAKAAIDAMLALPKMEKPLAFETGKKPMEIEMVTA